MSQMLPNSKVALQTIYLLKLLMQLHPIINPRSLDNSQPPWQYPLTQQLPIKYSKEAAQSLLELSYRVAIHNREVNDGVKHPLQLDAPGFDVVVPLDTTYMFVKVNVGWFFYSSKLNTAIFVATATYNNLLALVDINYLQVTPNVTNYEPGVKVHGGFWELYNGIRDNLLALMEKYVNNNTQVALCGLSLGGAVSTLAAFDLYEYKLHNGVSINNLVHYSFASPRLFNTIGAQAYNKLNMTSEQIHNGSDIIPVVPLPIMPSDQDFMHVRIPKYFDRNLGTYYDNHITAYLQEYDIVPIN